MQITVTSEDASPEYRSWSPGILTIEENPVVVAVKKLCKPKTGARLAFDKEGQVFGIELYIFNRQKREMDEVIIPLPKEAVTLAQRLDEFVFFQTLSQEKNIEVFFPFQMELEIPQMFLP